MPQGAVLTGDKASAAPGTAEDGSPSSSARSIHGGEA
jgi:hypothetical protein